MIYILKYTTSYLKRHPWLNRICLQVAHPVKVSAIPLQNNKTPNVMFYSNASGSLGCAAWGGEVWIHYEWSPEITQTPITPKETLPMMLECTVWGRMWKDKYILMYCDNEAALTSLNSGSSKEPWTMHLICCLFFIKARYPSRQYSQEGE